VLAHPTGHAEIKVALTVLGSAAVYLIGHVLFAWALSGRVRLASLGGLAVIAVLSPVSTGLSPLALTIATTLVLVAVAIAESWRGRELHHVAAHAGR
jgi:low temperature requirement protein LtrA